ncbi:hypothetical protein CAEBREN_09864 [Caenorhabditis brenneri]|uniref:T20D4.11-like domain-containing protein n=1 Tax=Caenorhabditis brenneri TaxID=135651 RepID=G0M9W6_CAEBE|nr:hypothetical protein CAEBREN_09864 [Caenorhabditis brenneri]
MLRPFIIFLIYCFFSDSAPLNASGLFGPNCESEEEHSKIVKCTTLLLDYNKKFDILNATDIELNNTKLTGFITLCKETMSCLEPTCFSKTMKDGIYMSCLYAEFKNTDFSNCINKISKEKPDLSSYNCLEPEDYANGHIETAALESKPECLKIVLEGFCGEQATANFDENVSKLLGASRLAMEIVPRLNGSSN